MIEWEQKSGTQWQGRVGNIVVNLYEDGFLWTADLVNPNFVNKTFFQEIADKLSALQFETNLYLGRVLYELDQRGPGVQGIEPSADPEITAYPGTA